jgi:hypothetical protein
MNIEIPAFYNHFRIPEGREVPRTGRPADLVLAPYDTNCPGFAPQAKGGATVCTIFFDGKRYTGIAHCSHSDNFVYREGRELALRRALTKLFAAYGTTPEMVAAAIASATQA